MHAEAHYFDELQMFLTFLASGLRILAGTWESRKQVEEKTAEKLGTRGGKKPCDLLHASRMHSLIQPSKSQIDMGLLSSYLMMGRSEVKSNFNTFFMRIHILFFSFNVNDYYRCYFINSGVRLEKEADHRQSALLEFISSNPPGAFRLRGVVSNLYLAMDKKGNLYGEQDYEDENTLFAEHADVSCGNQK